MNVMTLIRILEHLHPTAEVHLHWDQDDRGDIDEIYFKPDKTVVLACEHVRPGSMGGVTTVYVTKEEEL